MTYRGDLLSIETFDGETLVFNAGETSILSYGNFGAPPTNFITRRGYKQDGVTELDYFLEPRTWTLTLHHSGPTSDVDRERYWAIRQQLHDFLRPNRGGPLKFTLITEGRRLRSLYARANPGLLFAPEPPDRNSWAIDESLEFISHDPVFFDPTTVDSLLVGTQSEDLVFPIEFPIVFGFEGYEYSLNVTYTGTWKAYPTITLTGPYTQAILEQLTTGAIIQLAVPIGSGDTRILTLDPAHRSLVDAGGVNKWAELGPADLINWAIMEHPIAPNGTNNLKVSLVDADPNSGVEIMYNTRYFAI